MLTAQAHIKVINEARQANFAEKTKKEKEDDDPQLLGEEAQTGMNDLLDMNVKSDHISLEDRVGMLNADQRRIFDKVKKHPTPTTA